MHHVDAAHPAHLVHAGQAEGPAGFITAASPADAVRVHFNVWRDVDIDHRFELLDIQAARGHIGGHQHRTTAVGKLHQHLVAVALFQVAMQGQRADALGLQHIHQVTTLLFGIAKGQGARGPEVVQQQAHRVQAFAFFHFIKTLANLRACGALAERDLFGFTQEFFGQLLDTFRVGGREEQGLALFGRTACDGDDVVHEAHVEHAVGFVQHQGIERHQLQALALQVVDQAARCADDDMRAVGQAVGLRFDRRAATQHQHFHVVFSARQAAYFLRYLLGQFARGAQHQGLHRKAF